MNKYIRAARNTWEEALSYRFSFMMWRFRNLVGLLSIYFLWYAVIPQGTTAFGYNQSSILTYVLLTSLVGAIVMSNRSYMIGDEINNGNLSNFLLQPINYFMYWFSKDVGDKLMNIFFSIGELFLVILILKPTFFIQTKPEFILLFLLCVFLAIILYFFINILLGMVGFWSPDFWAPRFIFVILLGFFAGEYFPLNILPDYLYKIFEMLPFYYLIYFPIKIYLGQVSVINSLTGMVILILWIIFFAVITNLVWRKGLRAYSAQGK